MRSNETSGAYRDRLVFDRVAAWTLVLGIALTGVAAGFVRSRVIEREEAEFTQRAEQLVRSVERGFELSLEALHAVSALVRARPAVTPVEFRAFAADHIRRRPSLAALEWAPFVPQARRAAFEREMSAFLERPFQIREPADGGMIPAPARDAYAPLVLLEPYLSNLEGMDVRFEPARRQSVDTAIARRAMLATAKFRLVEDPPHVYSVAVYDPVFAGDQRLLGLSIALYRLQPLVESALRSSSLGTFDFTLLDDDPSLTGDARLLFATRPMASESPSSALVHERRFQFVGRTWTAVCSRPGRAPWSETLLAFALGSFVSALGCLFVASRQGRKRLAEALRAQRELGGYELVRPLGEGGMGSVHEGKHRLLRRRVAIKLVRPERNSPELTERFRREARIMAELSSPNTITLFDYGSTPDGRLYVVMEYLDGVALDALVRRYGRQKPERVRHLLLQVCESLAEAHDRGLVHRDIKPANIMLCTLGGRHDFVKVLDFGLAKSSRSDERLSQTGAVLGTFSHMAPECLNGAGATPRSDIYALGCVAYELLSGQEVFPSDDPTAVISAHLTRAPEPLDPTVVPPDVARVVMKCLEKDPTLRFQSARQLAHALKLTDLPPWTEADAAEWWYVNEGARRDVAAESS
jgi:CHASE1-domain containing sensor protein/tRNA A-37 threonylcarbamoyl transferase component Bud32